MRLLIRENLESSRGIGLSVLPAVLRISFPHPHRQTMDVKPYIESYVPILDLQHIRANPASEHEQTLSRAITQLPNTSIQGRYASCISASRAATSFSSTGCIRGCGNRGWSSQPRDVQKCHVPIAAGVRTTEHERSGPRHIMRFSSEPLFQRRMMSCSNWALTFVH
jgi:hypothetical protein